jgi:large subunit ribosomal protein L20
MPRVKRGVTAHARHKKVLKQAKGYYGARSKVYRVAKQAVIKAGQYAYRDRRQKKREFRALWIVRINAGAHENGLSYSRLDQRLEAGRHRGRPQGAGRSGGIDKPAFAELANRAKAALGIA